MFQPASDVRLSDEPVPAYRVVGVAILNLLQGHGSAQLGVLGDKHLAHMVPGPWFDKSVEVDRLNHDDRREASVFPSTPIGQGSSDCAEVESMVGRFFGITPAR